MSDGPAVGTATAGQRLSLPQERIDRLPAYLVMSGLGKRVLRPGGRELTRWLLERACLRPSDRIVELAPGTGITAEMVVAAQPESYTGVDRDAEMAARVEAIVAPVGGTVVTSHADQTGLESQSASLVIGEAMLTMQTDAGKEAIVAEAARLLAADGRYLIHELCLRPDDLDHAVEDRVCSDLSSTLHVGARPLRLAGWRRLLERHGFEVVDFRLLPLELLGPRRLVKDEGLLGAARFALRVARNPAARRRLRSARACFSRQGDHLAAIGIVAQRAPQQARWRAGS